LTELNYEKIAKEVAKLYSEKPELVFKLYDQLRKYFVSSNDFEKFMKQSNEQFQKILQEMDKHFEETNKRFEEINKRFEEINKRFEEQRIETNKRFKEQRIETNKRFKEQRIETNKRFEEINRRFEENRIYMDRRFNELALGYGGTFEGFNKTILKKILEERGIPVKAFNVTPIHFQDPEMNVHKNTTDVEVNIFSEDPPIIGEVTSSLVNIEKLETYVRKIQFIEKKFKKEFQHFFITLYVDEKIKELAKNIFNLYKIEAITLE